MAEAVLEGLSESNGRRTATKQRRRETIESAAARLLVHRTFDEITTKEVAAEAGIGEATLYRYIKSKQELLTMVYGDSLEAVLAATEENDAAARLRGENALPRHFLQRVLAIYRSRCDFCLLNPTNAARYLREGFIADSPYAARHLAQGDRTIRLVAAILREGQSLGHVRDDVDASLVAQNCHGAYIHEIDRTAVRQFAPDSIWDRLRPRLMAQLAPLLIDGDPAPAVP